MPNPEIFTISWNAFSMPNGWLKERLEETLFWTEEVESEMSR